mmetsp:Transcript_6813/g.17646  ORF Transcript_6813/g.17646 Transcript_6813/m.17646 type:complete len:316 (-) Transcript_6813:155-1102(-)
MAQIVPAHLAKLRDYDAVFIHVGGVKLQDDICDLLKLAQDAEHQVPAAEAVQTVKGDAEGDVQEEEYVHTHVEPFPAGEPLGLMGDDKLGGLGRRYMCQVAHRDLGLVLVIHVAPDGQQRLAKLDKLRTAHLHRAGSIYLVVNVKRDALNLLYALVPGLFPRFYLHRALDLLKQGFAEDVQLVIVQDLRAILVHEVEDLIGKHLLHSGLAQHRVLEECDQTALPTQLLDIVVVGSDGTHCLAGQHVDLIHQRLVRIPLCHAQLWETLHLPCRCDEVICDAPYPRALALTVTHAGGVVHLLSITVIDVSLAHHDHK